MEIKNAEQLHHVINEELVWRRKELHELLTLIETKSLTSSKRNALMRSTVMMIYAHWEGYTKACASAYLEFVSNQGLKNQQLSPNFIALSMRNRLIKASESKQSKERIDLVRFFFDEMNSPSHIPYKDKDVVETQSNLSSRVFENIVTMLGINLLDYEAKKNLIDESLLKARNTIAHGNYLLVTVEDVRILHEEFVGMMEEFRNQIDNSAATKRYRTDVTQP